MPGPDSVGAVPYRGLDTAKSFVLLGELDEAAALTRVGLRTLQNLHHLVEESAAVLTLLAIGSEKMLKTTVGLASLDSGQPWPSRRRMRDFGHDLNALNAAAIEHYEKNLGLSTAPGYIRELLHDCRADKKLSALLDMLSAWGLQARFHRLDELAGSPQSGDSPQVMWEEVESRVLEAEPELLARLGDPDGYDGARGRVNAVLVESFTGWWHLHTRAWMTGVIGKDAKGLATVLYRVVNA